LNGGEREVKVMVCLRQMPSSEFTTGGEPTVRTN